MKKKYIWAITLLLMSLLSLFPFAGCAGQTNSTSSSSTFRNPDTLSWRGKTISVFAGSASKPALDEAANLFEKRTGAKVYLTYGGSGTVLSQMELAKTGDLYIPG